MAKRFLFSGSAESYFGKCFQISDPDENQFSEHFSKFQTAYYPEMPNFDDGDPTYKYCLLQILENEEGQYFGFEKPGYYVML